MSTEAHGFYGSAPVIGDTSPGVARIQAINRSFSKWTKTMLFVSVFLVAYAYGLDGQTRYSYQAVATADYFGHSLLATVNVVRAVIAAASQPTLAKLMDVFGRFEVLACSIVFYVVGTIIEAASDGVSTFAGGAIIYQIGYSAIMLIAEVLIGDTTSLRNRVLFSFIPALPFIINCWISGNVTQAFLGPLGTGEGYAGWRWGIGSWSIIYTVCAIPLLVVLWLAGRRARKSGELDAYRSSFEQMGFVKLAIALFWQLDIPGIILVIAVFTLILTPFTIAGYQTDQWRSGSIIAMLVVGILCIPFLIWWEAKAPHPLLPFKLLRDRGVYGALIIAVFINFTWYLQGAYLFTTLVVSVGETTASATRITNIYSFSSVLTGVALGFVVRHVRYLKPFIISGVVMFMVAFGLLIRYRGGSSSYGGIIGAEVVLGIGGGLFAYPTQASIQSCTKHEHLAIVTALYLASYNIGSALGNSVSGAIWSQLLPQQLTNRLGDAALAQQIYLSPFMAIADYPFGTPTRALVVEAYQHVQRILAITGLCLCIPMLGATFLLRNHRLTDEQSLAHAEATSETSSVEEKPRGAKN